MLTSPHLHEKDREACFKTRSPPASLLLKGQVTELTTVKWTILVATGTFRWRDAAEGSRAAFKEG